MGATYDDVGRPFPRCLQNLLAGVAAAERFYQLSADSYPCILHQRSGACEDRRSGRARLRDDLFDHDAVYVRWDHRRHVNYL